MLLQIALFSGANRICVGVRFKSGLAVWLRVWLSDAILNLLGRHNPHSQAVTRSAQGLEQVIEVVNHAQGFQGSTTVSDLTIKPKRIHVVQIV